MKLVNSTWDNNKIDFPPKFVKLPISIGSVPCTSAAPYSQKKPGSSRLSDSMSDVNSVFHNTMNVGLTNVLVQLVSLHSSGPTS